MTESTNFIVFIIVRVIHCFFPIETHRDTNPSINTIGSGNRRRRNRHRRTNILNRIESVDFRHNITRGRIIYRARQITAQNRAIASQAEQAFIDAILQARQEIGDRHTVQPLRTRNERLARVAPEVTTVHTVRNQNV
jgi:hypothetical protein